MQRKPKSVIITKEKRFKASVEDGLAILKEFSPNSSVFIDCSENEGLTGLYDKDVIIERYTIEDFDKSVSQLNLAFSKKLVLLDKDCVLTKGDIENFKFSKSKTESAKYITTKDGFISCIRMAIQYYGGIVKL